MRRRADFEQQMKVLKTEFRRALPERIARIDGLWSGFQSAVPTSQHVRELKRAFHILAGSASTFGYPGVGEAARVAERALNTYGLTDTEVLLRTIEQSISALHEHASIEDESRFDA
jgi:chemotaxis protein histidine kinase CheA